MDISKKQRAGEILGRAGVAQRIIRLAENITTGSYKNAIETGAQISELIDAAGFDDRYSDFINSGAWSEQNIFKSLLNTIEDSDERDQLKAKMVSRVGHYEAV